MGNCTMQQEAGKDREHAQSFCKDLLLTALQEMKRAFYSQGTNELSEKTKIINWALTTK